MTLNIYLMLQETLYEILANDIFVDVTYVTIFYKHRI